MARTERVFVDSNIWLYTLDVKEVEKRKIANSRIEHLHAARQIVVSTQVLNEVFAVLTSKLGIPATIGKEVVQGIAQHRLVTVDASIIDKGIDIHILEQISYWDALMLAAAVSAKCTILLTEDLSHGQVIQGIRIENPFV